MKRETQQWRFTVLGTVAFVLAHTGLAWPTMSQAAEDPGIFFLQNVEDQFDQLALRPDGLAFSIGNSPDANPRQHYQGIVRRHGKGIPYLFVSRSGNRTDFSFPYSDTDDPGNLLIVRMGSRDSNGERLRSNRLLRDKSMDDTPPAAGDTTVNFLSFDGTHDWPNNHVRS